MFTSHLRRRLELLHVLFFLASGGDVAYTSFKDFFFSTVEGGK